MLPMKTQAKLYNGLYAKQITVNKDHPVSGCYMLFAKLEKIAIDSIGKHVRCSEISVKAFIFFCR